jgi:pyruvate-formate lyase-activating enzyme
MPDFNILQPTNSHFSFQIAWESTLKCNLDCSYCGDGHDNSIEHPSLEDSLKTVDFIVEYVNLYMSTKQEHMQVANLNIQGGESIFHPNIVEILEYARSKKNKYPDWNLGISLITNAIAGPTHWKRIASLVDYFTVSYHSESSPKQQEMFKSNVLHLKESQKNFHVGVMMHPKNWDKCINMVEWCKNNDIKVVPRQLDHTWSEFRFNYNDDQTEYLTGIKKVPAVTKVISFFKNGINLSAQGRACCGGNTLCSNKESEIKYVKGNNFKGWHCSVNKFFLYIRQTTGEIYTNKDCKMNLDGKVGVIGYLQNSKNIIDDLKSKLETNTLPTIICKKNSCWCGLCAPKADTKEDYDRIMKKYQI